MAATPTRIAVLAGSSLTWREQVMRGVASYAADHGPWQIYSAPEGAEDSLFFTESYRWDGLIVRVTSDRQARRVLALKVPAVSLGSVRLRHDTLPRVKVNDVKLVQLGLNHLLGTGLRRFAYCGFLGHEALEDRGPAFTQAVRAAGYTITSYRPGSRVSVQSTWQARQKDLMRWLKTLEKPIGILTWNPDVACQLAEAANRAGVRIPEDVAILSGDEDTVKCEITTPSISALEVPSARIGYEAAALLDRLMRTHRRTAEPILVEPSGILHARASTNLPDTSGRDIQACRDHIRAHLAEPITTPDLARQVALSRRTLERKFLQSTGRSIHDEIQTQRLTRAQELLLQTSLPIQKISAACGFTTPSYFIQQFRRATGRTPGAFRNRHATR